MEKIKEEKSNCEINPEILNLPNDIKDFKANNIQENFLFIGNLLKSNNLPYKKYGIFLTRKQLTLEVNPPIKELYENGFVQELMSILENFWTEENIVVRKIPNKIPIKILKRL
jgi:hypothetical protein